MKESTLTPAVAQARPTRLGTYLRNKPVSASLVRDDDFSDLADCIVNLNFDVWENIEDLETLERLFSDIEYTGRTSNLNDGILRAKKSNSQKRSYSKIWYATNRQKLAAKRRALKTSITAMANAKKKERLKKQRKTLNKKPIRKYPSAKGHTNERISFAEMVEPISKKYSGKLPERANPKYFLAEQPLQIGDFKFTENAVFILEGTTLKFEQGNNKYTIRNAPSEIFQYLRRNPA